MGSRSIASRRRSGAALSLCILFTPVLQQPQKPGGGAIQPAERLAVRGTSATCRELALEARSPVERARLERAFAPVEPPALELVPAAGLDVRAGRVSAGGASALTAASCPGFTSEPALDQSFDGQLDVPDGAGLSFIPPNVAGCVGPAHLMTMLSNKVLVQDRTGAPILTLDTSAFWSPLGTTLATLLRVHFDALSGRWLASGRNGSAGTTRILFAISRTDDPTGTWDYYSFLADPTASSFADWVVLGCNATWITITANMFNLPGTTFLGTKMWTIDKSTALVPGGPLTVSVFPTGFLTSVHGGSVGSSVHPARTLDLDPTLWMVTDNLSFGGTVLYQLSRITGTGPAPVVSGLTGSPFGGTSSACYAATNFSLTQRVMSQVGEVRSINTFSARVASVVVRNGKLWVANSGGLPGPSSNTSPTSTAVIWHELDPTLPFPATPGAPGSMVLQSGAIANGASTTSCFPSLAVNCADDVLIGFAYGDPTLSPRACYAMRRGTDVTGFMGPMRLLKAGESTYWKNFGVGTLAQYGLYSSTAVDPLDDRSFWTLQEYADARVGPADNDSRWGTRWGGFGPAAQVRGAVEPGPESCPLATPSRCECCLECAFLHPFSGEATCSAVDLRIPGRGFDLVVGRSYRSRIGPSTAQGAGWDFSYNVRVEEAGPDRVLRDGTGRADTYRLQPDGTWTRPEFFRTLQSEVDGGYTLIFPDTGRWHFLPLTHPTAAGQLDATVDRNGNTMTLQRDSLGRVATIFDTLHSASNPRPVAFAYNSEGLLASITDWTGRQTIYAYYQDGDAGGSAGDLKSVTTPPVTGTPNGNDFPGGKTTVYTYSKGFADQGLNHNLLTITDPKGQTFLTNVYASTTDPAAPDYDHVVRQILGSPDDASEYTYLKLTPSAANGFASQKTIVNDRAGNVVEHFYDVANREVLRREFTGRAPDPDAPTTETLNRPVAPLRATDPAYFETCWEYNDDALVTRIVHANLDEELFTYDQANVDQRARGNLLQHCRLPGPLGGDQAQICESFEYETGFGGCCGTNFVTRHVDGRNHETLHQYDAQGNRTHTTHAIPAVVEDWEYDATGQVTAHVLPDNGSAHRRRDEFTYYASGPQTGYLMEVIVDAPGLHLTTTHEHDALGRVVRTIDPRGHDTLRVYNALDQLVREYSRPFSDSIPVRYERDYFYDANDNLVRIDRQNVDELGMVASNHHLTSLRDVDLLNRPTRVCREKGEHDVPSGQLTCAGLPASEFITVECAYDANGNRALVRFGEATNGNQPDNVEAALYDERDLVYRRTRGAGGATPSTTQHDYDGNRNRASLHEGLEDAPHVTEYVHDGYDRLVAKLDPMGNVESTHYDANGNRTSTRTDGELLDVEGSAANVRLSETTYVYDALDRLVTTDVAFFDPATGTPIGDGHAVTVTSYSASSQVVQVTNDNGHARQSAYDTANRLLSTTGAEGNSVTHSYDANSNAIARVELEKSDLGAPDQIFTTTTEYDNVDRPTRFVDNVGNVTIVEYDSLDLDRRSVDPGGDEHRYVYDSYDRLVRRVDDLNGNGALPTDPVDRVELEKKDDSSRKEEKRDDNDNATRYRYDALDRRIQKQFADDTEEIFLYDPHDSVVQSTDASGTIVTYQYDSLDRLVEKTIVPGPGVSGDTTFERYRYDGLSRLVSAQDDDSLVTWSYDSMANPIRETLDGRTTTSAYDGVGNATGRVYPGGRTITTTFDENERKSSISDAGGTIAQYSYHGPERVERLDLGNGTRATYAYDGILPNPPGDSGVRQVVRTTHAVIASGALLDDRTYRWDPEASQTRQADVRPGGPLLVTDYAYDAIRRLVQSVRTAGGTIAYTLDGVGNRTSVSGGVHPGVYTASSALPEPGDFQLNQYTKSPLGSLAYDACGNLLSGSAKASPRFRYDYRGRLVDVGTRVLKQLPGGAQDVSTARYRYDALGRRIEKVLRTRVPGGVTTRVVRYSYDGAEQVIEERDGADVVRATYVHGRGTDELLTMQRAGVSYYYHADDHGSVRAVSNAAGAVVERYEYGDFGEPVFLDALGSPRRSSAIANAYLFTGREYDAEAGLYYFRARHYSPLLGRFVQRDPLDIWADEDNLGNGYTFVGNDPVAGRDPSGMLGEPAGQQAKAGPKVVEYNITICLGDEIRLTPQRFTELSKADSGADPKDPKPVVTIHADREGTVDVKAQNLGFTVIVLEGKVNKQDVVVKIWVQVRDCDKKGGSWEPYELIPGKLNFPALPKCYAKPESDAKSEPDPQPKCPRCIRPGLEWDDVLDPLFGMQMFGE